MSMTQKTNVISQADGDEGDEVKVQVKNDDIPIPNPPPTPPLPTNEEDKDDDKNGSNHHDNENDGSYLVPPIKDEEEHLNENSKISPLPGDSNAVVNSDPVDHGSNKMPTNRYVRLDDDGDHEMTTATIATTKSSVTAAFTSTSTSTSTSTTQSRHRNSAVSTYNTDDPEFEHIKNLYNNKETISLPSKESMKELAQLDSQIKDILQQIEMTDDINEIQRLSEKGDQLAKVGKERHSEHDKRVAEAHRMNDARHMAEQASQYWLKEQRDIKKYGEWKIILKMVEKVFPHNSIELSSLGSTNVYGEEDDEDGRDHEGDDNDQGDGNDDVFPFFLDKKSMKALPSPRKARKGKYMAPKDNRLRQKRDWRYVSESTFKFYLQGGQKATHCLEGHGFEWKDGYIYCSTCDSYLKRPVDMKQHVRSVRHKVRLNDTKKDKDEMENFFQRVLNEGDGGGGGGSGADRDCSSSSSTTINASANTSTTRDEGLSAQATQEQATQYLQNNREEFRKFIEWRRMQKVTEGSAYEKNSGEDAKQGGGGGGGDRMEDIEASATSTANPPFKNKNVPNPKQDPKRTRPKVSRDSRIRMERSWKFISEATFNFYLQGGKSKNNPLYGHGFRWEQGYIHCTFCDTYIKRPVDMKQHTRSGRHQRQLRSGANDNANSNANEPEVRVYENETEEV